ncbi:P-loop containing nucleoside triphosphate hydrolase protein [Crepidotus variabilis]|uniref:P-loop containing nucleoside triphosphate hydrolase protein n=1 Tax=Crepidotus variabilis TaxID=179855 RepID=A0A9P6JRM3_9AGAR|nr:P-loop containing nucleoside triphosphate hydrolase protein [Crepidotus variabilis]
MAPKAEIIIAIMGATGVGKSKMIDNLTENTKWSGTSLLSVTQKIKSTKCMIQGTEVTLVDTPGFDDTNKSDLETLHAISEWLESKYRKDVCLTGLLYLHRITDNRMAGTPYRNLKMFGKLCGGEEEVGRKVVFVSTMWDKIASEKGRAREKELKQYWQAMINLGAKTAQSRGTKADSEKIIFDLLKSQEAQPANRPVLIQDELVGLNRSLVETEAAQTLYTDFQRLLKQHKQTLADLESAARDAQNPAKAQELQKQREVIEGQLQHTFDEARKLKLGWAKRFMRLFQKKAKGTGLELGGA